MLPGIIDLFTQWVIDEVAPRRPHDSDVHILISLNTDRGTRNRSVKINLSSGTIQRNRVNPLFSPEKHTIFRYRRHSKSACLSGLLRLQDMDKCGFGI